jgi:hypothetical protein
VAHTLTGDALEGRALRLLQLSRSALMYLSLAVHHEERTRAQPDAGKVLPIAPGPVSDPLKH